ncbi:MAG: HU family DNA-binding protein [Desulfomonile tiedjei]|uniref:HU family DNA-binding protein n=1 Tax=Desulfomonile tiedjei TaxID=2358 RepID=A0A9D6V4N0_9BACT|nr:HU family DNA-binding protein [Desulfomonile tiedjei]
MTKAEVVSRMAEQAGISKKAAANALSALVGAVHESLKKKDGKIRISELGTFRVIKKKARNGVNPQTREKIKIAAAKVPRFAASKALRDAVKKAK